MSWWLTVITLTLLCPVVTAYAAEDEPSLPPLSIADVTGLIGSEVPARLAGLADLNSDDLYVAGIDVLSGTERLAVDEAAIPVTLQLFVRDGIIGAVKVEQDSLSHAATRDPQAFYASVLGQLLESAVKPDGEPSLGQGSSGWAFDRTGWVESSKGYDRQGMFFYACTGAMHASYMEFWQKWNAAIDEQAAGFMWVF